MLVPLAEASGPGVIAQGFRRSSCHQLRITVNRPDSARRIYNRESQNRTRGTHMIYRKFGRSGLEVSDIAHGLWGMGGWSGSDDRESTAALQLAVDLGCNFFDSAWAYGEGKSDGLLGKILTQNNATPNGKPL